MTDPQPCHHPRCGEREWHHAHPGGGFGPDCAPFKLGPNECECRVPGVYGTHPAAGCVSCGGTGYLQPKGVDPPRPTPKAATPAFRESVQKARTAVRMENWRKRRRLD